MVKFVILSLITFSGFAFAQDVGFTISREDAKKTFYCHEAFDKPVITPTKLYPVCQFALWCEPTSSSPVQKRQVYRSACRANDDGSCPRTEDECTKRADNAKPPVIINHADVAKNPTGQKDVKPGRRCHYPNDFVGAVWLPKPKGGYFAFCSNEIICEDEDKSAPELTPIVACDTKYGFTKIKDPKTNKVFTSLVCPPADECVASANLMKSELATISENKVGDEKISAQVKRRGTVELAGVPTGDPHAKRKEILDQGAHINRGTVKGEGI